MTGRQNRQRMAIRQVIADSDDYEPSPDRLPGLEPRGPVVRVLCRVCGKRLGQLTHLDLYQGPATVAPVLRCRRGHAPRPGLARLRELFAEAVHAGGRPIHL